MVKVRCNRCGYTWIYIGVAKDYATCPACRNSVKICPEKFTAKEEFKKVCELLDSSFSLEERRVAYTMLANLLKAFVKYVKSNGKEKIRNEAKKSEWKSVTH